MDAIDAMKARCSVREYAAKPVPRGLVEKIVDCGRLAPTARKVEPWEFIAVTDRQMLMKLAEMTDHGKFIGGCGCAIVVCCSETKYYLEDGCAATENILIAAADLGLGACWVAGDKKPYCEKVLNALGVPPSYKLISIVSIGYPAGRPTPLDKRPLSSVLHWERYGRSDHA